MNIYILKIDWTIFLNKKDEKLEAEVRVKEISIKPVIHENGFKPEPTLDNNKFVKILKIINDTERTLKGRLAPG